MKIAIVHDDLMRRGGAEQVALCFQQAFPDAPIYTLAYNPDATYGEFKKSKIITSWFQKIVSNENMMKKLFFPLGIFAMKSLELKDYDIVLMSTTYCAKYVKIKDSKTSIICYCHHPFRLLWFPESYSEYSNSNVFIKTIMKAIFKIFKRIDYNSAQRVHYFIANTSVTREKIAACYNKKINNIDVIFPAVDCSKFYIAPPSDIKDYYLIVSRLEYYKMVHVAIEAFNALKLPLIIVGKGTRENELKKLAQNNIHFMSGVSSKDLAKLYAECKAFIFPQLEDFGITALEANASGRPVIAYGQGGVTDTMVPFKEPSLPFTSLFFNEQNAESLKMAIIQYEKISDKVDPLFINNHAKKFDKTSFIFQIRKYVSSISK